MPTTVALHQLIDLAHGESKNEILLDTSINTELHIIKQGDKTIITFPYGNEFYISGRSIVIKDKP
jgi:hypothetical protein